MTLLTALVVAATATATSPTELHELLVGNKSANTVWRLSTLDGHRIGEFPTQEAPHEIAVAKNGAFAVIANYGNAKGGSTLSIYDFAAGGGPRIIDLGQHTRPHGLALFANDQRAIVTTEGSASLVVVDLAHGRVDKVIAIGSGTPHMVVVSPDNAMAYATKLETGAVSRIDLERGVKLDEKVAGAGAEGLALRQNELWVANRAANTLTIHDPVTLAVRQTLTADEFPIRVAFTPNDEYAVVTSAKAASVGIYDTHTKQRIATVPLRENDVIYKDTLLGRAPLPIGIATTNERLYVAISGGDRIGVIDTHTWRVIAHFATGREPDALGLR